MDIETIRKEFGKLAKLPDDQIDLVKGAFLIARTEYPNLDELYYMRLLDDMANRLKPRITEKTAPEEIVEEFNQLLFEEEGFRGDRINYYDPANSFLNQVLDWKTGIPITLSLIYIEVGRRAGLNLHGVGLPGHFITALVHESKRFFIDPFNRGEILTQEECYKRIMDSGRFSRSMELYLNPVKPRDFLARMLRNLKGIYRHMDKGIMTFQMIEWILALTPDAANELKERGLIYEAMGNVNSAIRDMKHYLENAPDAKDREAIEAKIETLKTQTSRVH